VNTSLTASIRPQFRTIDGLSIRYADTGGAADSTLLLTSPWPESLYAFRPMWRTLAEHARLFAVDLPGFGASERRDDLLSPQAMGGFLARLVAEAGLGRPHLVAPDVGTSAALICGGAPGQPDRFFDLLPRREVASARSRGQGGAPGGRTTLTAARTEASSLAGEKVVGESRVGRLLVRCADRVVDGAGVGARAPSLISVHAGFRRWPAAAAT
jgi:pimeloyl-ACP methyl ester carboxylesterase